MACRCLQLELLRVRGFEAEGLGEVLSREPGAVELICHLMCIAAKRLCPYHAFYVPLPTALRNDF